MANHNDDSARTRLTLAALFDIPPAKMPSGLFFNVHAEGKKGRIELQDERAIKWRCSLRGLHQCVIRANETRQRLTID